MDMYYTDFLFSKGINSVQYAKLEGKYCSIWDGEFGSIQEAQNKCTMEEDWPNPCVGIYADRCERSRSSVHLCRHNREYNSEDDFLPSSNGSCVFEKHGKQFICTPLNVIILRVIGFSNHVSK